MKKKNLAMIIMIICTFFTSSAQLFYKIGANKLSFNFLAIITNWQIILGMILYLIGAVLVIIALRWGEVTTLYPIITSSYVWVALGSSFFFNEKITTLRWTGITVIIVGILLITFGEKNKEVIRLTEAV